jgi:hypothetical protein
MNAKIKLQEAYLQLKITTHGPQIINNNSPTDCSSANWQAASEKIKLAHASYKSIMRVKSC